MRDFIENASSLPPPEVGCTAAAFTLSTKFLFLPFFSGPRFPSTLTHFVSHEGTRIKKRVKLRELICFGVPYKFIPFLSRAPQKERVTRILCAVRRI